MNHQALNEQRMMELTWKKEVTPMFKDLHSICSYLAMFPPYVPSYYIKKYTNKGDLVYEPFSGRGTTTLEAIRLGRRTISNDLSPLAYILTKSKTTPIKIEDIYNRINFHEKEQKKWIRNKWNHILRKEHDEIRVFFSKSNLYKMYYLREKIGKNFEKIDDIDNYILAITLGIMHGQTRKDGTSLYFSVSMPNGYSMAPNYAKNFILENGLKLPESDIFDQIKHRVSTKPPICNDKYKHKVNFNDALKSSEFVKESPKLIFTSPPYLNIVKYVSQNWIRFWMLGFDKDSTNEKIVDDYHPLDKYKLFMKNFMIEMKKLMNNESKLIMVIGDVKNISIREIILEITKECDLKYAVNPTEHILKRKLSNQMGNTKVGKATPKDWVFVLEK